MTQGWPSQNSHGTFAGVLGKEAPLSAGLAKLIERKLRVGDHLATWGGSA